MNKIKQILSLVTCLMILLSVAVLRSNKIWGNQLGGEKTEVADSLSAGPIVTADDGSMVVNTASLGKDIQGFAGTVPLEITVRNGVVESVRDVMSIENTGQYRGVYHVLGGIISPINGVGPSDLSIGMLKERVNAICQDSDPSSVELIFALNGDVEGETTAFYIYRQLSSTGIRFSSLARGLGFGDALEYADELTLGRSIVNRQIFKP